MSWIPHYTRLSSAVKPHTAACACLPSVTLCWFDLLAAGVSRDSLTHTPNTHTTPVYASLGLMSRWKTDGVRRPRSESRFAENTLIHNRSLLDVISCLASCCAKNHCWCIHHKLQLHNNSWQLYSCFQWMQEVFKSWDTENGYLEGFHYPVWSK